MRLQVIDPASHPDFLDLPWDRPLAEWDNPRVIIGTDQNHRHVVRFAAYGGEMYVLKELPGRLAQKEWHNLRGLRDSGIPVVDVVGVTSGRPPECLGEEVLITRYLDFSLPYTRVMKDPRVPYLAERLIDALAGLLVRLHLAGFYWGDCSLSNTLFRRDAGALSAYVVDTETGDRYPQLSLGQRDTDLLIATENVAGGLWDLQAIGRFDEEADPIEAAFLLRTRYDSLWDELTRSESFARTERYRITDRIRRLNDLGFDVTELELDPKPGQAEHLTLVPRVVEPNYHMRRLYELTGLRTGENQGRRLLADITGFGVYLTQTKGRSYPEPIVAARWLDQVFEPALERIPAELRSKLEEAELFHQVLDHRWYMSEQQGRDVGTMDAVDHYVNTVLRHAPDERTLLGGTTATYRPPELPADD